MENKKIKSIKKRILRWGWAIVLPLSGLACTVSMGSIEPTPPNPDKSSEATIVSPPDNSSNSNNPNNAETEAETDSPSFSQSWLGENSSETEPEAESEAQSAQGYTTVAMTARERQRYSEVIEQTKAMVYDQNAQTLAQDLGLSILNLTWEDTGRYYNSAVGPNISDMTIQVQTFNPNTDSYELHLMPVIRYPNFEDKSADLPLDAFSLLVGNEHGEPLEKVSLRDVLGNLRDYLHEPESWAGRKNSLLADRDSHVLVSAQACFLPIPQGGMAEFNPVLFNYQSYQGHPAVLTILATREGTSVTVIDNTRDAFEAGTTWGQRLFFNHNGERASLTAQRISDFLAENSPDQDNATVNPEEQAEAEGLNLVMLIQVPLKQEQPLGWSAGMDSQTMAPAAAPLEALAESDVEAAVIGHGAVEGPFTEIDELKIERDPDFPIRVTIQFYKGTSNGVVSRTDLEAIEAQIARVYDDADYVGSLVVDGPGDRPTEYDGDKQEPPNWWNDFWRRYNTQAQP